MAGNRSQTRSFIFCRDHDLYTQFQDKQHDVLLSHHAGIFDVGYSEAGRTPLYVRI